MKKGGGDEKEGAAKGQQRPRQQQRAQSESSYLSQMLNSYINFWRTILSALLKLAQIDNFFGIGFMIVSAFIVLNFLKNLCTPKRKKNLGKIEATDAGSEKLANEAPIQEKAN
jgi:hypothetical protein